MKCGWAKASFFFAITALMLSSPVAHAAGLVSDSLVINAVQLRGEAVSGQSSVEMVELSNPSANDIDVTGWCVAYATSTSTSFSSKGCLTSTDAWLHYFLPSGGSLQFVTAEYGALHPEVLGAFTMTSGLSNTSGQVKLLDLNKDVVDHVGWGSGSLAETSPIVVTSSSVGFKRQTTVDTGKNATDFAVLTTNVPLQPSTVVEVDDVCHNLDGLQLQPPDGTEVDTEGNCNQLVVDLCANLEGDQEVIPEGYVERLGACFVRAPIVITELLPNAAGSDTDNEFIELYNPGPDPVDLSLYELQVGIAYDKSYGFDEGTILLPGEYKAIYNSGLHYTLVNTQSAARLVFFDGATVSAALAYSDPPDGQSWALVGDSWTYTNQPTPNEANKKSEVLAAVDETDTQTPTSALAPCGPGKYRHPITNRCRNIESDTTLLVACDADEYRNPETNRCRKLTSLTSTLTPCAEGQERNPLTNRCRKIGAVDETTLTPCKEGQERNPVTNRCRTIPEADVTSQPVQKLSPSMTTNALVAASSIGAVGYGVYEWRSEMARGLRRLLGMILRK